MRQASHVRPSTPAPPWLRTTCAVALCRFSRFQTLSIKLNHWPPLTPLSRVSNMRSVHTLASVHAHFGGTSLPCLARGTPGRSNCDWASFTLPLSCPPSLHGRYPFHRYYEDSDSCPAPSSTRTGLLDSRTCTSGHSVSNHPMRPRSGHAFRSGQASPPIRFAGYRRSFGLRSLLAVSSVASGRIEFVSQPSCGPLFYGLSVHFQLLSTRHRCLAVTFSCWRLAPPERDFHPPMHVRSQAHEFRLQAAPVLARHSRRVGG